jgi:hypothetical protein
MATKTLTVKEVAAQLGTDGRELRKFLRARVVEAGGTVGEDTPGKGRRYQPFTAKEVTQLTKAFRAWEAAKASKKAKAEEAEVDTEVEEDDEISEEDTDEVTDEDELEPELD